MVNNLDRANRFRLEVTSTRQARERSH